MTLAYFPTSVKDSCFGAKGDGVTDDTVAIQLALSSGVPEIVFPPGRYLFSRINVPASIHRIIGAGPGATTFVCGGTLPSFSPWIYFDAITGIEVSGVTVEQDKAIYRLNHAFNFGGCTFGNVHDILIKESGFFSAYMAGCSDMSFEKIQVDSHGNSAITSEAGSNRIKIKDCTIKTAGTGHSIATTGGVGHFINGNYINGAGPGSFGIAIGGADSIVSDNRILANHREGINLQDASRVSILNNIVKCDEGHADFAISIYAANAPVEGCLVSGNKTGASGGAGIGIASTNNTNAFCRYNRISDNHAMNPVQAGVAIPFEARAGVLLYGPQTAGNVVQANTTIDQAANMRYGVAEWDDSLGAPSYNSFIHNHAPIGAGLVAQSRRLAATTKVWDLS